MNDNSQLLGRVEKAVGPAAATSFVEERGDRHFIFELTLSGVALYLLGKYLDGFIEGLGIGELGKEHGQAVLKAAQYGFDTFTGKRKPDKKVLEQHAQSVSQTVVDLREHRSDPQASARGIVKLVPLLEARGIPGAEAER